MKLEELKGYKKDPAYNVLKNLPTRSKIQPGRVMRPFIEYAEKNGWVLKGSGSFGSVLHKPGKDYVYKIYYDDGNTYKQYVKWAFHNQSNPFVPKVGKLIKIPGTDDVYANKIEILKPAKGENDLRFKQYIKDGIERTNYDNPFVDEDFGLLDYALYSLYETNPDFYELIENVKKFGALDMHKDNVMWRGDQLVITDPVW